jgi:hypothetical protein
VAQNALEADVAALKARKTSMADDEYRTELERLLRLAPFDRQIRQSS